MKNIVGCVCMP